MPPKVWNAWSADSQATWAAVSLAMLVSFPHGRPWSKSHAAL